MNLGHCPSLSKVHACRPREDKQRPSLPGAGEEQVFTELKERFRDACFRAVEWSDVVSERFLSPPCEGGEGGVMHEPWRSRMTLLASREECERTERQRAWEDLLTGRAVTTPPNPPFARGGKVVAPLHQGGQQRAEIRTKAQLLQDQDFSNPGSPRAFS